MNQQWLESRAPDSKPPLVPVPWVHWGPASCSFHRTVGSGKGLECRHGTTGRWGVIGQITVLLWLRFTEKYIGILTLDHLCRSKWCFRHFKYTGHRSVKLGFQCWTHRLMDCRFYLQCWTQLTNGKADGSGSKPLVGRNSSILCIDLSTCVWSGPNGTTNALYSIFNGPFNVISCPNGRDLFDVHGPLACECEVEIPGLWVDHEQGFTYHV